MLMNMKQRKPIHNLTMQYSHACMVLCINVLTEKSLAIWMNEHVNVGDISVQKTSLPITDLSIYTLIALGDSSNRITSISRTITPRQ